MLLYVLAHNNWLLCANWCLSRAPLECCEVGMLNGLHNRDAKNFIQPVRWVSSFVGNELPTILDPGGLVQSDRAEL